MARDNYALQKTKLQKEIARLQKKVQGLDSKRRTPKIAAIVKSMRDFDISLEDVAAAFNSKKGRGRTPKPEGTVSKRRPLGPAPIRYRHPATGATWTGRGRAPRWVSEAEAAGQHRSQFLIQPPDAPAAA